MNPSFAPGLTGWHRHPACLHSKLSVECLLAETEFIGVECSGYSRVRLKAFYAAFSL